MIKIKRQVGLDLLKILCCLMVIFIHVSDEFMSREILNFQRTVKSLKLGILLNSASRASVPLFIMITGSFLLEQEYKFSRAVLYKHIYRIIKVFLLGTILYTIIEILLYIIMELKILSVIEL